MLKINLELSSILPLKDMPAPFDNFFLSHVLVRVPSSKQIISQAAYLSLSLQIVQPISATQGRITGKAHCALFLQMN